jgi:hypothetical protein
VGPEWWILVGLVGGPVLVGAGVWLGRATLDDAVTLHQERTAYVLEQLEEALAQGEAGVEASRVIVATERRLAEATRAATRRGRRRLLLGAAPPGTTEGDPPASPPGGGTEGPEPGTGETGGPLA